MKILLTAAICTISGIGIGLEARSHKNASIIHADVLRTSKLEFASGTSDDSRFSIELEKQLGRDSLVIRSADTSTTVRLINGMVRLERAGASKLAIGLSEDGGASMELLRPNGFPAIRMSLNPMGLALIGVYDAAGRGQDINAEGVNPVIVNFGK